MLNPSDLTILITHIMSTQKEAFDVLQKLDQFKPGVLLRLFDGLVSMVNLTTSQTIRKFADLISEFETEEKSECLNDVISSCGEQNAKSVYEFIETMYMEDPSDGEGLVLTQICDYAEQSDNNFNRVHGEITKALSKHKITE